MINQYQRSGHDVPDSLSVKEIMRRAKQCLKTNSVIQIEVHHARSLFEEKEPEQGRNIFESLVTSHPKRYYSFYLDPTSGQSTSTKRSSTRTSTRLATCWNELCRSTSARSQPSPY